MEDIAQNLFSGATSIDDLKDLWGEKDGTIKVIHRMQKPLVDNNSLKDAIQAKIIGKLKQSLQEKAKREGIEIPFDENNATLKDIKTLNPNLRIMVTLLRDVSNETSNGFKPDVFDTEDKTEENIKIIDAGLATSAAPVYFEPVKHENNNLIDGGTYANNPAGLGFALSAVKVKAENIKLLSVGTGQPLPGAGKI